LSLLIETREEVVNQGYIDEKIEVKGKMILSLSKIYAPEPRPPPYTCQIDLKHHINLLK